MFIEFFKENYRLIIDLLAILIAFILLVVRKRSLKDITSYIYQYGVLAVIAAENSGLKGDEKLAFAVKLVKDDLLKKFPNIEINYYIGAIHFIIEELLSTPQKKED